MNARFAVLAAGILVVSSTSASPQETTERVSVDSSGAESDGDSGLTHPWNAIELGVAISDDGRVVAFASEATNLVSDDRNGKRDVFVHDRTTGVTERVSVDSSGAEADGNSILPSLSADGTLVAFESSATNLVAGGAIGGVFVRDRLTGTTERVSVDSYGNPGNASSGDASISSDGRFVAFRSEASNLVGGDANGKSDVFVHDRSTGTTERVSVDSSGNEGNGASSLPSISTDGRFVVFTSLASNLVAGDTNSSSDVFIHDRSTGNTERVSISSTGAEMAWAMSAHARLVSSDGSIVAFMGNYVNPWADDIFVRDRSTGITEYANVSSSGVHANDLSNYPALSADGMVVTFSSLATNLIDGRRTSGYPTIFVHDRTDAMTEMTSVDSSGTEGNSGSLFPRISADGQVITFASVATNLVSGDNNGFADVFVHERCAVAASWTNYGQGYPGTNGIPILTSRSNPVRGQSLTLDLGNSSNVSAFGLLFVGFQRADIPSSWGGHLLVDPTLLLALDIPPTGTTVDGLIADDDRLCGVPVDLQVMESDPGALKGVSFTPGLELVLGY